MSFSKSCPNCKGTGKIILVAQDFIADTVDKFHGKDSRYEIPCNTCSGTGWVLIVDSTEYHPTGYVLI